MRPIDADSLVDNIFNEMRRIANESMEDIEVARNGLGLIVGITTALEVIKDEPTICYNKHYCDGRSCENWNSEKNAPQCFIDIYEGGKNETD